MKTDLMVTFVTSLFLLGTASVAQAEVPCQKGNTYQCDAYNVCACKPTRTKGDTILGDVVVVKELDKSTAHTGGAQILLGDGSVKFLRDSTVVYSLSEEELLELSLAFELTPEEVLVGLLLPAVQR